MTDETKPTADGSGGIQSEGIVAANTDRALLVAQFADASAALTAYQALVDAEVSGDLLIDGVLVVRADANGQIAIENVTDHSTQKGVKWGIVGGVVLGVLFPPSIIGSAVALGVTGGVLGKLRHEHQKTELTASLSGALGPNRSGVLVLAMLPTVPQVKSIMPQATKVTEVLVDNDTAEAIIEASRAAAA